MNHATPSPVRLSGLARLALALPLLLGACVEPPESEDFSLESEQLRHIPIDGLCGDGYCADSEMYACIADCHYCGDDYCDSYVSESFQNCPQDCSVCGDGSCTSPHETLAGCPADCAICGDDVCSPGEGGSCLGDCCVPSCADLGTKIICEVPLACPAVSAWSETFAYTSKQVTGPRSVSYVRQGECGDSDRVGAVFGGVGLMSPNIGCREVSGPIDPGGDDGDDDDDDDPCEACYSEGVDCDECYSG